MKKIKVTDLENLFELVLKKLKSEGINEIPLDEDYYWNVSAENWNDFNKEPDLEVGSLSDDFEELKKLLIDKKRPMTYVDFDRLASLLYFISKKFN